MTVVDLGAAWGGGPRVTGRLIGGRGRRIASGILPTACIPDAASIQGQFTDSQVFARLPGDRRKSGRPCDFQYGPQYERFERRRHARVMYSCELAVDFSARVLHPGGEFLIKIFQGEGFEMYLKSVWEKFGKVQMCKPLPARDRSREQYLLARGFRGA